MKKGRAVVGELGSKGQEEAVRETFVVNQLKSAGMDIGIPGQGDFLRGYRTTKKELANHQLPE